MSQANNFQPPVTQPQRPHKDPYAEVSIAANDLLSFAQQSGTSRAGAQTFAIPPQPTQVSKATHHMPVQPVEQVNGGRRNTKGSINSLPGSIDPGDFSESGQSEQKTNTRSRSKKGAATNGKQNAGSKRKADEPKANNRKKVGNGTSGMGSMGGSMGSMDDDSEEDTSPKPEDGKKMTDEEKRKNFLERNRSAVFSLCDHPMLISR
jgi:ATF/CREB family transcription factor